MQGSARCNAGTGDHTVQRNRFDQVAANLLEVHMKHRGQQLKGDFNDIA